MLYVYKWLRPCVSAPSKAAEEKGEVVEVRQMYEALKDTDRRRDLTFFRSKWSAEEQREGGEEITAPVFA